MNLTPVGVQQQQVSKLLTQVQKLGADLDNMQGTTRVIYDRQNFAGLKSYNFFEFAKTKNFPATNLQENRLQPGEAMVIKEIGIAFFRGGVGPDGQGFTDLFKLNFQIGNNTVIKDLSCLTFGYSNAGIFLNPINGGTTQFGSGSDTAVYLSIRLLNNIVIPPQIQFKMNLELAAPRAGGNTGTITAYLKGYGKLFNPRNNY